ncbi:MAG: hypothetical protein ACJ77A_00705 [Actinomycetota bacterium]
MKVGKPFRLIVLALVLIVPACGPYARAHRTATPVSPSGVPGRAPEPSITPQQTGASQVHPESPAPTVASSRATNPSPAPGDSYTSPCAPSGPDLSAYRGLGTWIDVYDQSDVFGPAAFGDPTTSVAEMVRNGVRTVFLEAGSYRHPAVAFPTATARFIRAAHAAGKRVVAWYLPLFRSVEHDFAEVVRVLRFRTPDGEGYDGFALDIEAAVVPAARRIANFLTLSAAIRAAVGPDYALGAIIPSPRGLIRVPAYWPGFPYSQLPRFYDVVLPMSYFTFHEHGAAQVLRYVEDNVEIVRRATGEPGIPVHVIGGIADDMSPAETTAFVRGARSEHVFGASLYEFPRTSAFEWRALAPLR